MISLQLSADEELQSKKIELNLLGKQTVDRTITISVIIAEWQMQPVMRKGWLKQLNITIYEERGETAQSKP